jgi:hypothetical protein
MPMAQETRLIDRIRLNSVLGYLESYSSAPSFQRVPKHEASEGPLLVGIRPTANIRSGNLNDASLRKDLAPSNTVVKVRATPTPQTVGLSNELRRSIHSQFPVAAIVPMKNIQAAAAALGIWSKCRVASPL